VDGGSLEGGGVGGVDAGGVEVGSSEVGGGGGGGGCDVGGGGVLVGGVEVSGGDEVGGGEPVGAGLSVEEGEEGEEVDLEFGREGEEEEERAMEGLTGRRHEFLVSANCLSASRSLPPAGFPRPGAWACCPSASSRHRPGKAPVEANDALCSHFLQHNSDSVLPHTVTHCPVIEEPGVNDTFWPMQGARACRNPILPRSASFTRSPCIYLISSISLHRTPPTFATSLPCLATDSDNVNNEMSTPQYSVRPLAYTPLTLH
jgi:hypothetical protein